MKPKKPEWDSRRERKGIMKTDSQTMQFILKTYQCRDTHCLYKSMICATNCEKCGVKVILSFFFFLCFLFKTRKKGVMFCYIRTSS